MTTPFPGDKKRDHLHANVLNMLAEALKAGTVWHLEFDTLLWLSLLDMHFEVTEGGAPNYPL